MGERNRIEQEGKEMGMFLQLQWFRHRKANCPESAEVLFQSPGTYHYNHTEEKKLRRVVHRRKHRHTTHKRILILVAESFPETLFTEQERQNALQNLTIRLRSGSD